MHPLIPKEIRENLARTRGYLRRDELPRALETLGTALRQTGHAEMPRAARQDLESLLTQCLADVSRHPVMQGVCSLYRKDGVNPLIYQKDKEGLLATVLESLGRMLQEAATRQQGQQYQQDAHRKNELINTGIARIQAGELALGRDFIKRAAAEFGQEDGLYMQLGQTLAALGQHADAGAMLEKALAATPKDPAPYAAAIAAYTTSGEYAKAERVYRKILHQFGGHPRTYGKMAELYLLWEKPAEAEDMAQRALHDDPQQAEALGVLNHLRNDALL